MLITARLIRASTGNQLWVNEFNGSTADLLELQSNVATAIADEIRAEITPAERQRIAKTSRKVAPEAQDAYLLGRYQLEQIDLERFPKAIASFRRAVSLQPDYAEAYAALSYALRAHRNSGGPATFDEIRSAAFKALELDPDLADAHSAVGAVSTHDWQWERAEQEFRRAVDLNPESEVTCDCYSGLLSILGRHSESVALAQRIAKVNPMVSASFTGLGERLYEARRYPEAEVQFCRALDMEPQNLLALGFLGAVYQVTGRADAAVRLYEGSDMRSSPYMAAALADTGRRREAMDLLRAAEPKASPFDYLGFARAYAFLGDKDRAFQWLTRAFDEHGVYIEWARVSPTYDVFRDDPRFEALVARLRLPT